MKTITCGELVPGCEYKARAETEADLLSKVSEHVRSAHPDIQMTPKMVEKVKAKIHDE
ncbi:DUF1059 domain-containing protein [Afifella sp. IM 167]|uniref:DUF1059 domain-containing protein n=1 Tax=Afifella sp. IM 167 TaxID=2033586 RepID=UPI001CCE7A48|nr:DUF1059 domain-containing protein [Afifella sp. IM 167]MBZ8134862.1 small metal-binding protein [Afifella sp. IM 167]